MLSRYSDELSRRIWSDVSKYIHWARIEIAVVRHWHANGLIPDSDFNEIIDSIGHFEETGAAEKSYSDGDFSADCHTLDLHRISEIEKEVRHDVIAFVNYLEEICGKPGRWIHYGLTSSDVVDTGLAIQLSHINTHINNQLNILIDSLSVVCEEYSHVKILGRTHGVPAQLTTVGKIFGSHKAEIERSKFRFQDAARNVAFGKLSGAIGTNVHLSSSEEVRILESLKLCRETEPTQIVPRDRHANYVMSIALIATAIERLATNIRLYHRPEIGEICEGFALGQRGSSAMPHKKNPISCENLCGLARMVRSYVAPAMENAVLWHERDISHSSVERHILPDATSTIVHMIDKSINLIDFLEIDEYRCDSNIENVGYQVNSENALLLLIRKGISRKEAYAFVQKVSMKELDAYDLVSQFGDVDQSELEEYLQFQFGDPPSSGKYVTLHEDSDGSEPYYTSTSVWDGNNWSCSYQYWPVAWKPFSESY